MTSLYRVFSSQRWHFLLPLVALALYFYVSLQLGVNHDPDEHMRLKVPLYMHLHNTFPMGDEPEIIKYPWGYSYAFTAYGPSMLAALFMKIAGIFSSDLTVLIVAARFTNVLSGALTVLVSMRIARRLFTNQVAPLVMGVFVGFTPQFVFLSSYLNNDVPSALSVAIIVLAWIKGIQDGWNIKSAALLGFGLGACAITYYFGYAFILASILVFFVSAVRESAGRDDRVKHILRLVGVIFLVAFAAGGWYFVRNGIIYHGDILGMSTRDVLAEKLAHPGFKPSDHSSPRLEGWTATDFLFKPYSNGQLWALTTVKSSIGLFGYMRFLLPSKLYWAYGIAGLVFITIGVMSFRTVRIAYARLINLIFLSCAVFVFFLSFFYSWTGGFQAQGRYLYSAFVPIMIYMTNGIVVAARLIGRLWARVAKTESPSDKVEIEKQPLVVLLLVAGAVCYIAAFFVSAHYGLTPCMTGDIFPDTLPRLLNPDGL